MARRTHPASILSKPGGEGALQVACPETHGLAHRKGVHGAEPGHCLTSHGDLGLLWAFRTGQVQLAQECSYYTGEEVVGEGILEAVEKGFVVLDLWRQNSF